MMREDTKTGSVQLVTAKKRLEKEVSRSIKEVPFYDSLEAAGLKRGYETRPSLKELLFF